MATLPMDIITSILTKLPSKSLARFKCVSKAWIFLINSPRFISLHRLQSLSSNNRLLILNYGTHLESTPFSLLGPHFDNTSNTTSKFDIPTCFSGYEVSICGSIHGLVALVCKNVDDPSLLKLILWNPSTNTHSILPRDDVRGFPGDDAGEGDFMGVSFGFGYDCSEDDYRIVKIVDKFYVSSDNDDVGDDDEGGGGGGGNGVDAEDGGGSGGEADVNEGGEGVVNGGDDADNGSDHGENGGGNGHVCRFGFIFREVIVYSLRENIWRKVHVRFTGDKMEWYCPGALISNHLVHWIFWDYMRKIPRLRGCDLSSLEWFTLGLPNFRGNDNKDSLTNDDVDDDDISNGFETSDFVVLGVLNECLCLVTRICLEFNNAYVWVMKEYGVKESWTVLFNVVEAGIIGPLSSAPLGCSEDGDEVLVRKANDEDDGLWCYNVREKAVKDAPKICSSLKLRDVSVCIESLVPVIEDS